MYVLYELLLVFVFAENWDTRADNLKKQSHLLTAPELRKRGITRYDAEILLAQGISLPRCRPSRQNAGKSKENSCLEDLPVAKRPKLMAKRSTVRSVKPWHKQQQKSRGRLRVRRGFGRVKNGSDMSGESNASFPSSGEDTGIGLSCENDKTDPGQTNETMSSGPVTQSAVAWLNTHRTQTAKKSLEFGNIFENIKGSCSFDLSGESKTSPRKSPVAMCCGSDIPYPSQSSDNLKSGQSLLEVQCSTIGSSSLEKSSSGASPTKKGTPRRISPRRLPRHAVESQPVSESVPHSSLLESWKAFLPPKRNQKGDTASSSDDEIQVNPTFLASAEKESRRIRRESESAMEHGGSPEQQLCTSTHETRCGGKRCKQNLRKRFSSESSACNGSDGCITATQSKGKTSKGKDCLSEVSMVTVARGGVEEEDEDTREAMLQLQRELSRETTEQSTTASSSTLTIEDPNMAEAVAVGTDMPVLEKEGDESSRQTLCKSSRKITSLRQRKSVFPCQTRQFYKSCIAPDRHCDRKGKRRVRGNKLLSRQLKPGSQFSQGKGGRKSLISGKACLYPTLGRLLTEETDTLQRSHTTATDVNHNENTSSGSRLLPRPHPAPAAATPVNTPQSPATSSEPRVPKLTLRLIKEPECASSTVRTTRSVSRSPRKHSVLYEILSSSENGTVSQQKPPRTPTTPTPSPQPSSTSDSPKLPSRVRLRLGKESIDLKIPQQPQFEGNI